MNDQSGPRKVDIDYPCSWTYQVIGRSEMLMREAISQVVGPRSHEIRLNRQSRTGKFCSLHLEMTVENEQQRIRIFELLKTHEAVAFVL